MARVAACLKQCIVGIVALPVNVILCRMLYSHQSTTECVRAVWQEHGLAGFYAGAGWWLLTELSPILVLSMHSHNTHIEDDESEASSEE